MVLRSTDDLEKVETLIHYTYKKSKDTSNSMMVLDIQRSLVTVIDIQQIGNVTCDPEIVTENTIDVENEFLFCLGNLVNNTIQVFLGAHECSSKR